MSIKVDRVNKVIIEVSDVDIYFFREMLLRHKNICMLSASEQEKQLIDFLIDKLV